VEACGEDVGGYYRSVSDDTTFSFRGIEIKKIGVEVLNTRKTWTEGIFLEVGALEAIDLLAKKLQEVIGGTTRVTIPQRQTPVIPLNVPDWVDQVQSNLGTCRAQEIGPKWEILHHPENQPLWPRRTGFQV